MPVSGKEGGIIPCALCPPGSGDGAFEPALECEGFSFVRCKKCGLVQQNPRLNGEEIIARYSGIYGKDYLSYEIANEEAFLKLQKLALKDAGFPRLEKKLFKKYPRDAKEIPSVLGPTVLDVGCATGALIADLRGRKWHVTGVEISPCAQYAREERGLDVRSVPLEENNFPEGGFDAVLASHLIEHLNDPMSFLREACRILKKGGRIFVTTPDINGFQARLFKGRWRSAIFDHLYLFSGRTLVKMLKIAGFKIESIRTWGGLAAGAAPPAIKKITDFLVKIFNCGDVMIIRASKK